MSEKEFSTTSTRRKFLAASGAASVAFAAGCVGGDDDDTVELVLNPAEDSVSLEAQYQPIIEQLEEEFDIEFEGTPTGSYNATIQELQRAGSGDRVIADSSPAAIFELGDEVGVIGMRVAFGGAQYFGTLATTLENYESGITEVSDLEDERVTTLGTGSVSGGIAPMWMLQNGGLDLGQLVDVGEAEDFEWVDGNSHDVAVGQLLEDDDIVAAGAGEFQTVPHVPESYIEEEYPEMHDISAEMRNAGRDVEQAELRFIDVSPPLPRAPLLINDAWEEDLRFEIEEFFLDLEPEDLEHDAFDLADELDLDLPDGLLEDYNDDDISADPDEYDLDEDQQDDWSLFNDNTLWFTGIEDADEDDYEPLRDLAEDLDIAFEELG